MRAWKGETPRQGERQGETLRLKEMERRGRAGVREEGRA